MTKFHCRRQFGMNFGNVTENEMNSNYFIQYYPTFFVATISTPVPATLCRIMSPI